MVLLPAPEGAERMSNLPPPLRRRGVPNGQSWDVLGDDAMLEVSSCIFAAGVILADWFSDESLFIAVLFCLILYRDFVELPR